MPDRGKAGTIGGWRASKGLVDNWVCFSGREDMFTKNWLRSSVELIRRVNDGMSSMHHAEMCSLIVV